VYEEWAPLRAAVRNGSFDRREWTPDGSPSNEQPERDGSPRWEVLPARRGPEGTVIHVIGINPETPGYRFPILCPRLGTERRVGFVVAKVNYTT